MVRAAARMGLLPLALAAACRGASDPAPAGPSAGRPAVRVVAQEAPVDTAHIDAPEAAGVRLVVRVVGADGRAAVGVAVRFTSRTVPGLYAPEARVGALVLAPAEQDTARRLTDTTLTVPSDAAGEAAVRVFRGWRAGTWPVVVEVPALALRDSVVYESTAASLAELGVVPEDTALYVGGELRPRVARADRAGNPRTDPVTVSVPEDARAVATADAAGAVRAVGVGRVRVTVAAGGRTSAAFLSVVPRGRIATYTPRRLGPDTAWLNLVNLDGSALRRFPLSRSVDARPAWHPSGAALVHADSAVSSDRSRVGIRDTATGRWRALVPPEAGLAHQVTPSYSPDGAWVYFSAARVPSPGAQAIYRARADGAVPEGAAPEAVGYPAGVRFSTEPAVAPDGALLAYTGVVQGRNAVDVIRVDVIRVDGGPVGGAIVTALAGGPRPGYGPKWSPRGEAIVYTEGGGLTVVGLDGGTRRRFESVVEVGRGCGGTLTGPGTFELRGLGQADWSPDGQWLVAGSAEAVVLVRVADGLTLPLCFAAGMRAPAWRPR